MGCGRRDNDIPPVPSDDNTRYERLLRNRLKLQEEIFKALEAYRTISQKVREGRAELQQLLGDKLASEAIEHFTKGTTLRDLQPAYARWRTLIPDERTRFAIVQWLDKQQLSHELVNMDVIIKDVENRRDYGWAFDQKTNEEISRSIAQVEASLEELDRLGTAIVDEEVIKSMITEMEQKE